MKRKQPVRMRCIELRNPKLIVGVSAVLEPGTTSSLRNGLEKTARPESLDQGERTIEVSRELARSRRVHVKSPQGSRVKLRMPSVYEKALNKNIVHKHGVVEQGTSRVKRNKRREV